MKEGWAVKPLGEVCQIRPPKAEARQRLAPTDGVSFVPMESLGIGEKTFVSKQTKPLAAVSGSYTYFAENDLLLAKITPCFENGKLGIARNLTNGVGFGSSEYIVFRPSLNIHVDWLYHYLNREAFRTEGASKMSGAVGHKRVPLAFIETYPIPVPPIEEQQRIVAKLDEAFEGIASAKEKAEQNLLNARALFDSYLDDVFSKRGEEWDKKQLSELCERITKGSSPKWQGVSYVDRPGILFVTSENVGQNKLLLENPKYVEEKFNVKDKKSILTKGDVLTNIVGASIGRTAIFDLEIVANINQAVCLMRCIPSLLNNAYLTFLLNSKVFKKILHDNEVNNARANLSLGFFSKLYIPLPNLDIQINIVAALNEIQKKVEELESLYQQKITALDELKQSLLHQAFSGEL